MGSAGTRASSSAAICYLVLAVRIGAGSFILFRIPQSLCPRQTPRLGPTPATAALQGHCRHHWHTRRAPPRFHQMVRLTRAPSPAQAAARRRFAASLRSSCQSEKCTPLAIDLSVVSNAARPPGSPGSLFPMCSACSHSATPSPSLQTPPSPHSSLPLPCLPLPGIPGAYLGQPTRRPHSLPPLLEGPKAALAW